MLWIILLICYTVDVDLPLITYYSYNILYKAFLTFWLFQLMKHYNIMWVIEILC